MENFHNLWKDVSLRAIQSSKTALKRIIKHEFYNFTKEEIEKLAESVSVRLRKTIERYSLLS